MRRIVSLLIAFIMILSTFIIMDVNFNNIITNATADTLSVGFGFGNDSTTIQGAIDMADPGDTIFVYSGIYNESAEPTKGIFIDKTITLLGEDKETTIINVPQKSFGVHIKNVEYVNISGFTVMGSSLYNFLLSSSNHSKIHDNNVKNSGATAVGISSSSFNTIENNDLADNLHGISISGDSSGNIVRNNMIESSISNADRAIILQNNANDNTVEDNTIVGYNVGVYVYLAEDNEIENNGIFEGVEGIRIVKVNNILVSGNIVSDNDYGIKLVSSSASIVNCSFDESEIYDLWIEDPDVVNPEITLLNTTFDENKVEISDDGPTLVVKFYLHVTVVDESNQPVGGIAVKPKDNANGLLSGNYITDSNGEVNWILLPYFIQNYTAKTKFTPFNISASSATSSGFTLTDAILTQSISITVKLFSDMDGDGDGVSDANDAFPEDPNEWMDTDLDGVGDNGDAFPNDLTEQTDTDSDGVGNNGDDFPSDSAASEDSDGDGYPESWNTNKSKADSTTGLELDEFPNDSSEWKDSDGDGIGDNSDFLPSLHNTVFILIIVVIIVIIIILAVLLSKRGKKPTKWDDEKTGDENKED